MSRLEIYFLLSEGENRFPSGLSVCGTESLPRPPHGASAAAAAAAVLQRGGPEGGADWREAAASLGLMERLLVPLLLLEALRRGERGLFAGAGREEVQRVPPAVRVALAIVAPTEARLQLLPQEAHGHLQDVGFLQLGVGLLLVELFLQDDLELLDAAVDAVSAHFLHNRFSQLGKRRQPGKFVIQFSNKQSDICASQNHLNPIQYSL